MTTRVLRGARLTTVYRAVEVEPEEEIVLHLTGRKRGYFTNEKASESLRPVTPGHKITLIPHGALILADGTAYLLGSLGRHLTSVNHAEKTPSQKRIDV